MLGCLVVALVSVKCPNVCVHALSRLVSGGFRCYVLHF